MSAHPSPQGVTVHVLIPVVSPVALYVPFSSGADEFEVDDEAAAVEEADGALAGS
jgi:hypothetical protein